MYSFKFENENKFTFKPFSNSQESTYLKYKGVDYKMYAHYSTDNVTSSLDVNLKMISLKLPIMFNYEYDMEKLVLKKKCRKEIH